MFILIYIYIYIYIHIHIYEYIYKIEVGQVPLGPPSSGPSAAPSWYFGVRDEGLALEVWG